MEKAVSHYLFLYFPSQVYANGNPLRLKNTHFWCLQKCALTGGSGRLISYSWNQLDIHHLNPSAAPTWDEFFSAVSVGAVVSDHQLLEVSSVSIQL